ncbi:hypothetical protein MRB53_007130 [Persea americana]|uniref:Uncharacterized protein n=1 Tax=Persea americana TaxID=3435 RepID=A0ACC2MI47_PERAE|nr:hypothetical protein MRB53_007130 [Persea americana]
MHLRVGQLSTFAVSSAGFAKEFMKTHDLNFVDRPQILHAKLVGCNSIFFFIWRLLATTTWFSDKPRREAFVIDKQIFAFKDQKVISGLKFKLERVHRKIDRILDDIVQEHEKSMTKETNEGRLEEALVDVLLRLQHDRGKNRGTTLIDNSMVVADANGVQQSNLGDKPSGVDESTSAKSEVVDTIKQPQATNPNRWKIKGFEPFSGLGTILNVAEPRVRQLLLLDRSSSHCLLCMRNHQLGVRSMIMFMKEQSLPTYWIVKQQLEQRFLATLSSKRGKRKLVNGRFHCPR